MRPCGPAGFDIRRSSDFSELILKCLHCGTNKGISNLINRDANRKIRLDAFQIRSFICASSSKQVVLKSNLLHCVMTLGFFCDLLILEPSLPSCTALSGLLSPPFNSTSRRYSTSWGRSRAPQMFSCFSRRCRYNMRHYTYLNIHAVLLLFVFLSLLHTNTFWYCQMQRPFLCSRFSQHTRSKTRCCALRSITTCSL